MSNLHSELEDSQLHVAKGFASASNGQRPWRNEKSQQSFDNSPILPQALSLVSSYSPPPTEVMNDIYLLSGTATHSNWDNSGTNSWTRYDGTTWNGITPNEGDTCYNKNTQSDYIFNSIWREKNTLNSEWNDVTFNSGDYVPNGGGSWTVDSGDVVVNRYKLIGKTLYFNLSLTGTTIVGPPAISLLVKMPNGYTAKGSNECGGFGYYTNGGVAFRLRMLSTSNFVDLRTIDGSALIAGVNDQNIHFSLIVEIE